MTLFYNISNTASQKSKVQASHLRIIKMLDGPSNIVIPIMRYPI